MALFKNYSKDGKCSGCGRCCTSLLPLSELEIYNIRQYLKKHEVTPVNWNAGQSIFNQNYIDKCPFLSPELTCQIYEARPSVCKWFGCYGNEGRFNHKDKKVINMTNVFYPEYEALYQPDVKLIDEQYQESKKKAFGG